MIRIYLFLICCFFLLLLGSCQLPENEGGSSLENEKRDTVLFQNQLSTEQDQIDEMVPNSFSFVHIDGQFKKPFPARVE